METYQAIDNNNHSYVQAYESDLRTVFARLLCIDSNYA